jgi:acyl-coenzyme A synthetase/AMP-(fatty) acid ligase
VNLADYCLYQRIEDDQGDVVALRFGDRSWTYEEVASRSSALARWMIDEGFVPETRVYVVLRDVPPFAWSVFATLAAGGILTMGNPEAPAEDLLRVLDYVKARVLVTTPTVATALAPGFARLPHLRTVLLVPDVATGGDSEARCDVPAELATAHVEAIALADALAEGRHSERALPRVHPDDPAVWLFTSGSTGAPKAAMHTHRDFIFNTEVYAKKTVGYRADDVTVSVPRLFFGYATGTNLWFPFAVGATVGLFAERPTPESLAAAIAMYRPTIVTNVPTMLGKLIDYPGALDMSCVRFHLSAGEALPPTLLERFLARFGGAVYDGIGSAEMFHIYASNRPGDVKPGSLGRVVDGYELRVLPEDAVGPGAAEVPRGEIGVLWVKGDSVAYGYYQDRD